MSRRALMPTLLALALPGALAAQDSAPTERIDILVDTTPEIVGPQVEDCSEEQEAAAISGEIVVCRRFGDQGQYRYSSNEDARKRYATATMDKGAPRAPDLAPSYPGVVVARGCFIPPCPPPPAYMIDLKALPEAPPGSDADRVGRGLAPRGRDVAAAGPAGEARREALDLPPPPDFAREEDAAIPAGSEAPEGER